MTHSLPHNPDAERATVGSLLLDGGWIEVVRDWLDEADFWDAHCRAIYAAMRSCDAQQIPIDLTTVASELRQRHQLEEVGGVPFLVDLSNIVPIADHIEYYARIVQKTAIRRRLIEAISTIATLAYNESGDLEQTLDTAERLVAAARQRATPRATTAFQVLTLADLWDLPPPKWLVSGEIAAGKITMLWGASQSGKTFVAVDYAMRIALESPVLYVAAEDAEGVSIRAEAWVKHHKPKTTPHFFSIIQKPKLLDTAQVDLLIAAIKQVGAVLVVIDTMGRTIPGADENSARDMRLVIEACDRIPEETGAGVLLVHHAGKTTGTYRGSGTLKDDAYTSIEVSNIDGTIVIDNEKAKNTTRFEPIHLKLAQVQTSRIDPETGQPVMSCVVVPASKVYTVWDDLTQAQRKILEALSLDIFLDIGAKTSQIAEYTKLPHNTLYTSLSSLKQRGLLSQGAKGDPYTITQAGTEALQHRVHSTPGISAVPNDIGHSNHQVPSVPFDHFDPGSPLLPVPAPIRSGTGSSGTVPEGQTEAQGGVKQATAGQVEHARRLLQNEGKATARRYMESLGVRRFPSELQQAVQRRDQAYSPQGY